MITLESLMETHNTKNYALCSSCEDNPLGEVIVYPLEKSVVCMFYDKSHLAIDELKQIIELMQKLENQTETKNG